MGDLALVVGAGVSMAAGMPGWDDLALEMVRRALRHGTSEHRRELHGRLRASTADGQDGGGSVVVDGRLFVGPSERLDQFLDQHLVPAGPKTRNRLQWAARELGGKSADRSAALLAAAGRCWRSSETGCSTSCATSCSTGRSTARPSTRRSPPWCVRRTSRGRGPRACQILTYNFDDLLETAIREAGHESLAYISKAGQADLGGIRPGRPFGDVKAERGRHLPSARLRPGILRRLRLRAGPGRGHRLPESQLRAHYGEDASWITHVQRATFGNAPNLILGSSLEDQDAVRRLTSVHERRPGWFNFAVMQLPEHARRGRERLGGQDLDDLGRRYRAMGIRVLWIAEFDEIQGCWRASPTQAD